MKKTGAGWKKRRTTNKGIVRTRSKKEYKRVPEWTVQENTTTAPGLTTAALVMRRLYLAIFQVGERPSSPNHARIIKVDEKILTDSEAGKEDRHLLILPKDSLPEKKFNERSHQTPPLLLP